MDINIRLAVPADAEDIHRFICELAVYEREPNAVRVTVAELAEQLASSSPPFECLMAETLEGTSIGFAVFFESYSTWRGRSGIYLEDLYVPEPIRGRGVGGKLFQHLGQIALQRGCARLEWAVLDWNQPAIDFYHTMGATRLEEWTTWRLTDEPLVALAKGQSSSL
jgi:GNAT superfamily N-acetyltransferase